MQPICINVLLNSYQTTKLMTQINHSIKNLSVYYQWII